MARSEECYWIGRDHLYFLRKNFAGNWRLAFLRLMIGNQQGDLPSALKLLGSAVLGRKISSLWLLKDYMDALSSPFLVQN